MPNDIYGFEDVNTNLANQRAGSAIDTSQADYLTKLGAATREVREDDAASNVFSKAVENFKEEVSGAGNIHEINASGVKLDIDRAKEEIESNPDAVSPATFGRAAFEAEYGLNDGALSQLEISSHGDAVDCARRIAREGALTVSDADLNEWLANVNEDAPDSLQETLVRAVKHIDTWNSPVFGSGNNRTPEQIAAVNSVTAHALRSSIGLHERGFAASRIESLLNRSRLVIDHGHSPGQKSSGNRSQSLDARTGEGYGNIHAAYMNNPF